MTEGLANLIQRIKNEFFDSEPQSISTSEAPQVQVIRSKAEPRRTLGKPPKDSRFPRMDAYGICLLSSLRLRIASAEQGQWKKVKVRVQISNIE